jgi:putative transposase
MNALLDIALGLVAAQACACGGLMFIWLWRHRDIGAPHAGPRRSCGAEHRKDRPSRSRAKPEWVRQKVVYLASHLCGCRRIRDVFNRWHGLTETVGHTFVWQVMCEHREQIDALRRTRRRRKPLVIAVRHCWALDLTFIRSPDGLTFTVLAVMDAGSRRLLALRVLPRKCALLLLGHLLIAIAQFGMPHCIRTDNEAMFHSRLWRRALGALAIRHRFGPPMQPWRDGRVERLIGTLKQELRGMQFYSGVMLQVALDAFADHYNTARPHQALGGLTPAEAWEGTTLADVQLAYAQAVGTELLARVLTGFSFPSG